ncbi:MAG: adenylate/guanylate cyclase domain-containing protein [Candidatus Dormibacteraceae bacterium]
MPECPSCRHESPVGYKFCPNCGAPLAITRGVEERKSVTVLFCDLVGFTTASDQADPEDVQARIRPYHSRLRAEITRFGGTVEKFIGDAVMAVFGAPVAHEDDAERAVRAGLRIIEAINELNNERPSLDLQVRVGINTGEAVVALQARPDQGEGMVTGDVVNTASRLEGAAPVGAVVVGEATYRTTKSVFEYQPLEPLTVKGKNQPIPVWRALAARGWLGTDLSKVHTTPLVGRELERRLLQDTFERTIRDRSVQLVTIIGEPGVGKSRLVAELLRFVDDWPDIVRWRQGRCLPYGSGVTFWALGEIVKAEAGILESDSPEAAAAKLDAALAEDVPDREWLRQRLAPLVGLAASSAAEREEGFTAWRRFLELIAERNPAVFVLEDLHWADAAFLAFVEHVADWSEGVPMLLLATARPELYERQQAWAGGKRNATSINLSPLTATETARLISVLLESAVIPAEVQSLILERAGGNPLYAEEFVRLLLDRGLLVKRETTLALVEHAEVPVPEGLQALIAARLDTLSAERKAMLQDAAVIGKVFWLGALADMGGLGSVAVLEALHELSRKELVRPARSSSLAGQTEYSFWHILIRDVAYSQIPRADRIDKHRRAAAWIESAAGERIEDLAEVLAHHYTAARDLAVAAGQGQTAKELESPALRFLTLAGDRALGLDAATAEANFARALELAPPGHPDRPEVLARWAEAARQVGRHAEAGQALEEAAAGFRAQGDVIGAARTMTTLANVLWHMGDPRPREVAAEAVALLESGAPVAELVAAYAESARLEALSGEYSEAIKSAEKTLALANDLGLEEPAKAIGYRGFGRCALGDAGGLEDMRRALDLSIERGQGREAGVWHLNLAVFLLPIEGPAPSLAVIRQGIDFAERRRITEFALNMRAESLMWLTDLGSWDEVVQGATELIAKTEATGSMISVFDSRLALARVLARQGRAQEALPHAEWALAAARRVISPDRRARALIVAALVRLSAGQREPAGELLAELAETPHGRDMPLFYAFLPESVRTAVAVGDRALAERLATSSEATYPYEEYAVCAARAMVAEAQGDTEGAAVLFAEAARRGKDMGVVPERAFANLGEGRCLLALGRSAQGYRPLRQAREVFARLGAKPALAETDALLARITAPGS